MQYPFLFYGATVCTVTAINLQNVCTLIVLASICRHAVSIAVPAYALLTVNDLQYVCSINHIFPVSITNSPSPLAYSIAVHVLY